MESGNFCGLGVVVDSHFDQVWRFISLTLAFGPLLSMVSPIAWFAVKILICVGTVPEMPILNSEVLLMSAPLLAFGGKKISTLLYWYKNPDTRSRSFSAQCGSGVCGWTVVGDSARLLPAAFASLFFASLFAALRVPAMPYAVYVGFVCGIALFGPCPLLARFQSFGSVLVLLTMTGQALSQCSFLDISCCNEMHGCWHGAAMWPLQLKAVPLLEVRDASGSSRSNGSRQG